MRKLFGLFVLALAFLPSEVWAAPRFAVCTTTCTWDNSSTAMWSATSGGATGASAPTSADTVTLDAATCVGGTTCTITTFAGTISILSLTMSACTASTAGCILEASTNNTNFVLSNSVSSYVNTGSGTRTLNMGTGTWTLSGNEASWNIVASATLSAASSTIAFTTTTGTINARSFTGAGKTYGTVTISSPSVGGVFNFGGANTIGTLTISAPNRIFFPQGTTTTVTNLTNISGSSSAQTLFGTSNVSFGTTTISSANNFTCDWCGFNLVAFSGGGTFTGSNSFSFGGGNSGITITAPSGGGGGGGGRIIGG